MIIKVNKTEVSFVPTRAGWVMLRCGDIPVANGSDFTYDQVENESDDYSKLSDYGKSQKQSKCSKISKDESAAMKNADISIKNRPPMKTPGNSSSGSSDDEEIPLTGAELMKNIEKHMNQGSANALPLPIRNQPNSHKMRRKAPPLEEAAPSCDGQDSSTRKEVSKSRFKSANANKASSSDDEYDYTPTKDVPRNIKKTESARHNSTIPEDCFQTILVKVAEDDNRFESTTYFSSHAFFNHFCGSFHHWSERIGINGDKISAFKAAVCCNKIKTSPISHQKYCKKLEFIPVIPVPYWPGVAKEWPERRRAKVRDLRTNILYQWPQSRQISDIVAQGCYLVAEGGKTGGHLTANNKLEWQLSFGNAREILISGLSQQHLTCLTWLHLIHRHYLESMGILSQHHIETIFFRLVEHNFIDWADESMGERVQFIFKKLHECIKRGKLVHYFINKRNLFSSKAQRDLYKAQERVWRLLENFLPVVMQMAHRIHSADAAHPFPDLVKLWEIITTKKTIASLINPDLTSQLSGQQRVKSKEPLGFWEVLDDDDRNHEYIKRERDRVGAEQKNEKRSAGKASKELFRMDTVISPFNFVQTKEVLEFFIHHFIAQAQSCNKSRNYATSNVLLCQADNLATILGEEGSVMQAKDLKDEIKILLSVSRQQFRGTTVNFPGSPCVFNTGLKTNSSLDNSQDDIPCLSIALTPLPEPPVEHGRRSRIKNHVPKSQLDRTSSAGNSITFSIDVENKSYSSSSVSITDISLTPNSLENKSHSSLSVPTEDILVTPNSITTDDSDQGESTNL